MEQYEVHVSGLEPYIVPIAFPESIVVRAGDVTVIVGAFDLEELEHRVALLDGQVLAVFVDEAARTGGPPSPLS